MLDDLNLSARITKKLVDMPDKVMNQIAPVNLAAIKRTADVGLGIKHDKYRLEAGLSSTNIDIRGIITRGDELLKLINGKSDEK